MYCIKYARIRVFTDPYTGEYGSVKTHILCRVIKYLLFHHYLTTTNLLLILRKKPNTLILFFAKQCSTIKNDNKLPQLLHFLTDKRLSTVKFENTGILKIIHNFNPNKAHGQDKVSIRMLKICGNSLCRFLELLFDDSLTNGIFPSDWKKVNIVPVHKKNDKQRLNHYRPISLLPKYSKIFERLIFNEMFGLFFEKDLISQHQSGFNPEDSCTIKFYQLLTKYTNRLMKVFMSVVYSRISKTFDKVWHDDIIFKLKQNGNLVTF